MAEQPLNLMAMRVSLRRRRWFLVAAAVLGALAGIAFVVWRPPSYSSQSVVLLGAAADPAGGDARDMSTEAQVARSDVVLGPARKASAPDLSRRDFAALVAIDVPTADVLSIVARAPTAADAELRAEAVAESIVNYQASSKSSLSTAQRQALDRRRQTLETALDTVRDEIAKTEARIADDTSSDSDRRTDLAARAQLTAQESELILQIDAIEDQRSSTKLGGGATVIQSASPGERPGLVATVGLPVGAGIALVVLLVGIVVLVTSGRDRRLFLRDDIARALGRPVLAGVRAQPRRDAAAWQELFTSYSPDELDDLALRQALLSIGLPGPPPTGRRFVRLTVVSFAHDPAGHCVAPQLAAHAASVGITTRYTILDTTGAAPELVSACAGSEGQEVRPGLWLAAKPIRTSGVALAVTHLIVDGAAPRSPVKPSPTSLLALSPGSATSHDVARLAVFVHKLGGIVVGCVVSNPDPADGTTGRLRGQERANGSRSAARQLAEPDGDAA